MAFILCLHVSCCLTFLLFVILKGRQFVCSVFDSVSILSKDVGSLKNIILNFILLQGSNESQYAEIRKKIFIRM